MGKKESYECNRRFPDRAQPLGIDVRVARGCCDTLIAQERLHVAQVGLWLQSQFRSQCRLLLPIAPPSMDGRLPSYFLFAEAGTDGATGFFWPLTFFAIC